MQNNPAFQRLEMLTGSDALDLLRSAPVILFGIGGVGSWCAEALVRSGVGNLTIVDSDLVCVTNINRQVQATAATVGKSKVKVLRDRLLEINPDASIEALQKVYGRATSGEFELSRYAYVIDAIDGLSGKVELLMKASAGGAKVFTALGASCKLDPTRIRVDSLWNSEGCHLGRYVRKKLRRYGFNGEVTCVYSSELLPLFDVGVKCGTEKCMCPKIALDEDDLVHEWCTSKKQINGSAVHITGIFGFTLAGLVIQDIVARCKATAPAVSDGTALTQASTLGSGSSSVDG